MAITFDIHSIFHMKKYIQGQLVSGFDIVFLIECVANPELICQNKQVLTDKNSEQETHKITIPQLYGWRQGRGRNEQIVSVQLISPPMYNTC